MFKLLINCQILYIPYNFPEDNYFRYWESEDSVYIYIQFANILIGKDKDKERKYYISETFIEVPGEHYYSLSRKVKYFIKIEHDDDYIKTFNKIRFESLLLSNISSNEKRYLFNKFIFLPNISSDISLLLDNLIVNKCIIYIFR